jgi:effector-binding domain-containing protein
LASVRLSPRNARNFAAASWSGCANLILAGAAFEDGMEPMRSALWAACLALGLACAAPVLAQQPAPGDAFGVEVTLAPKTIVSLSGTGKWDSAFETVVDALKVVHSFLEGEGVKPDGPALVIYTTADDSGFQFEAALPIAQTLRNPPKGDIVMGTSPEGKAYKFTHRGSYDGMDNTYEAITNFLDQKNLDSKDLFVEEYVTDPRSTPEDKLVINVYVPIR